MAARTAVRITPAGEGKLARALRARRGVVERVRARAAAVREFDRPLLWFHAPSVGEGLQARPVVQSLRALDPSLQFAYTFFSPSAERFAASLGAEITDYLPFDGAREADAMLDALRPSAIVFAKLDVWPTLVERATGRGIPVALLSATVSPESGRLGAASRAFTSDAYAALAAVGAIDEENAGRLVRLGVRADRIRITGDTRFDQVWARATGVDRTSPLLAALASARPTLVAGSTWPADEAVLFPAWNTVRAAARGARLIVAPHEPTGAHVAPIRAWATKERLSVATLTEIDSALAATSETGASPSFTSTDVVIIDRVGVLGDLYALADVAFVGGGFHDAGLHSAIEPAAFGAPVVFGPRHGMSREAGLLLEAGGARTATTPAELAIAIGSWLANGERRAPAGAKARAVVEEGLGATERSAELVLSVRRAG